jgi:DNA-binding beta-propeller fold protein YncE
MMALILRSSCGRWMAVSNHGNDTVAVFERRGDGEPASAGFEYGPEPTMVIKDPGMRYPHSVSFSPKSNHLVVTNAGANFFNIYQHDGESRWAQVPMVQQEVADATVFRETNLENSMEGGPKGVAVCKSRIAVCSPQIGVRIYRFRETRRQN